MEHPQYTLVEKIGIMFSIASPNRTSFENVEDVPDYVNEVIPLLICFLILEFLVAKWKKMKTVRLNDAIASVSGSLIQELLRVMFVGGEIAACAYVYKNWRITTLPWNSVWTWLFCLVGVDFFFYWSHRAAHEINILWALHEPHHSSEDYNLTIPLRQPVLKHYVQTLFHIPLALAVPPSIILVHHHLNTFYQIWIHTEVVDKLGILEYVLNTPSHHRVHHGRNRYCIDKNYGGIFIIWDRLFGTFQEEDSKVVYGVTHPINTFQQVTIQFYVCMNVCRTFWKTKGFSNKLSVLFKGPGWAPGKPRCGLLEDIPDVHYPAEKYDVPLPLWCNAYVAVHFGLVFLGHMEIMNIYHGIPHSIALGMVFYEILSLISIGALLDTSAYAPLLELVRCALYMLVDAYFVPLTRLAEIPIGAPSAFLLRAVFYLSATIWLIYICGDKRWKSGVKRKVD